MMPFCPFPGIGPQETVIEEGVLETALTFEGGLLGTENNNNKQWSPSRSKISWKANGIRRERNITKN